MPPTPNRVADKLLAFGPLGYWFALIRGHDGHLSRIPLTIGGVVGSLGLVLKLILKLTYHRKQEAL